MPKAFLPKIQPMTKLTNEVGVSGTLLEIDLDALAHNYRVLRAKLTEGTRFLGVVKAFAYGSDMVAIARKLERLGADYLAVAYVREGILLREGGVEVPVLVLHPQHDQLGSCVEHCLEPALYSFRVLREFSSVAQSLGIREYPVHLKFNTGLNRLGFRENDLEDILHFWEGKEELKIRSVLSHLGATDDMGEEAFTRGQIASFERICGIITDRLGYQPIRHLSNTSGIFNFPEANFDMVRSGIGLYGFGNDPDYDSELRPIARLTTVISQIHRIEEGDSVGYNRGFIADQRMTIATLPIGHADGIGRHLGNGRGGVWINGRWAPVTGWVCMDMIMVDITDIPCTEGDRVVVFDEVHSAEELAGQCQTISYEVLTSLTARVERRIIETNS